MRAIRFLIYDEILIYSNGNEQIFDFSDNDC